VPRQRIVERQAVERAGLVVQHQHGPTATAARQMKFYACCVPGGVGPIYAGHARSFPMTRMVATRPPGVKQAASLLSTGGRLSRTSDMGQGHNGPVSQDADVPASRDLDRRTPENAGVVDTIG